MKMKFLLTTVPLLALVMHSDPAIAQQKNEIRKKETRSATNLRSVVTDDSGETSIDYQDDGHRHKIRMKDSKIIEMSVDGKKVPEEDFSKYDAVVKQVMLQIEKDREEAGKDRLQADKDRIQADKDRTQADKDRQQADLDRDRANLDRQQADNDRALMKGQQEQAEVDRQQADKNRENIVQYKKQIQVERQQTEQARNQATKDRERAVMDRKQAEKDRLQAGYDREQANEDRKQAELDRKQADEDRKLLEEMINEVVKEKMADSKESVKSIILDDTELIVNGIKQSGTLHTKFKAKYLKKSGSRISYKNSGGFKGISFD
jgi:hypothetical protein